MRTERAAGISNPHESQADMDYLRVSLTAQGSSDFSLQLSTSEPAAPLQPPDIVLSDHAQQQYEDQLRKAQETLLPQAQFQVCLAGYSLCRTF